MNLVDALPTIIAALNAVTFVLLMTAWRAVRGGDRKRHKQLMIANLAIAALFLIAYLTQIAIVGHKRFPGDDWVRSVFVAILGTHTVAAVSLLPLVPMTVYRAFKDRVADHRRIGRITISIWTYVSVTGILIYWMVNHLRPALTFSPA